MKLIVAIVQPEDARNALNDLTARGFRATRIKTVGGFLHEANATLLLGVDDDQVGEVLAVLRENCLTRRQYVNPLPPAMEPGESYLPFPLEVEVGGATIFVLGVERAERL
ncbi:MAG: cyclic-di-AMP receptor [Chloroflexi bacterium]|nr:cyclic-di-AMP receptor [Chloroflexota bacterium]